MCVCMRDVEREKRGCVPRVPSLLFPSLSVYFILVPINSHQFFSSSSTMIFFSLVHSNPIFFPTRSSPNLLNLQETQPAELLCVFSSPCTKRPVFIRVFTQGAAPAFVYTVGNYRPLTEEEWWKQDYLPFYQTPPLYALKTDECFKICNERSRLLPLAELSNGKRIIGEAIVTASVLSERLPRRLSFFNCLAAENTRCRHSTEQFLGAKVISTLTSSLQSGTLMCWGFPLSNI